MIASISKSDLRKQTLGYRKVLLEAEYTIRNNRLNDQLLSFLNNEKFRIIHTFIAIEKNREPNMQPIFDLLWEKDIKILVSKTNFEAKTLTHYFLNKDTLLEKNHLDISEPSGDAKQASLSALDAVFIPLLVADKEGFRIGYGGGYYDRLLSETKAIKVGLSLSPPVDKIIQRDEWDVPLDYLITPYKTYNYG